MTPSGSRNPRHRPPPVRLPPSHARERVRAPDRDTRTPAERHLAENETCQWQARMVRCMAEATDVVESRERVLRSSCEQHVPAWLRTGGRRVA